MATLFARFFPGSRTKLPLIPVPYKDAPLLFQRTPPFWARWALVFVALDVMVSTSAMEITWNNWTVQPTGDAPPDEPVLQPVWKRTSACVMHFMSGCLVAGSILGMRSRLVRSVTLAPPSFTTGFAGKRLYVQTASNPYNHGIQIPARKCRVVKRNGQQLFLEVGGHGKWLLDLRGATINGNLAPSIPEQARGAIMKLLSDSTPFPHAPKSKMK